MWRCFNENLLPTFRRSPLHRIVNINFPELVHFYPNCEQFAIARPIFFYPRQQWLLLSEIEIDRKPKIGKLFNHCHRKWLACHAIFLLTMLINKLFQGGRSIREVISGKGAGNRIVSFSYRKLIGFTSPLMCVYRLIEREICAFVRYNPLLMCLVLLRGNNNI